MCFRNEIVFNSAEHKIFSANKDEKANNSWHFHIYWQRNVHAKLRLVRMCNKIVNNLRFISKTNTMLS